MSTFKGASFSWWGKILLVLDIIGFGFSARYGQLFYDASYRRGGRDYLGLLVIVPLYMLVVRIKHPGMKWGDTWRVSPMDGDAVAIGLMGMHLANILIGYGLSLV